jgi:hypothetical protein
MKSNILLVIVILACIGCDSANGGGNSTTPSNVKNKTITLEVKKAPNMAGNYEKYTTVSTDPVEIMLDNLSFEEAFEIEHLAKGEGRTFWWRGNQYTTNLYETEAKWLEHDNSQWVRNSKDLDDKCYSNEFDECGVCDGPGKPTWYKDWDEDGLGNPNISMQSCIYPSVDEE